MQTIINIIVFIFILGMIIILHECGHMIMAKLFGVYCSQFSIGFGPKIWKKKYGETEYEVRALPIGGFVSMAGETDQEDVEEMQDVPYERTLTAKKTYQKVIIFLAGVTINFILGFFLLLAANLMGGTTPLDIPTIDTIVADSPAQMYGLESDDVIEQIYVKDSDKTIVTSSYDIFSESLTKEVFETDTDQVNITLTIKRDEEIKDIDMVLDFNESTEKYYFGISFKTRRMGVMESITATFDDFVSMSFAIIDALRMLVVNFAATVGQLSGPVGIYQVTAEVTQTGSIPYLLSFIGMLSINVGIFNLMPIPGLDGYQVLVTLVERVIGHELPQNMKLALQMAGLALVMLLMIIVTYQDILRLFG